MCFSDIKKWRISRLHTGVYSFGTGNFHSNAYDIVCSQLTVFWKHFLFSYNGVCVSCESSTKQWRECWNVWFLQTCLLSGFVTYFWTLNLLSKPFLWSWEKTARDQERLRLLFVPVGAREEGEVRRGLASRTRYGPERIQNLLLQRRTLYYCLVEDLNMIKTSWI